MADELKRVVVWKNLQTDGRDYCALLQTAEGWLLRGTVVGLLKDHQPILAQYEIHCDNHWLTHRVQVECNIGKETKTLALSVESRGVWRDSGHELPQLSGCLDVDLALTPATNTLPIRRLHIDVGGSAPVVAAWVKMPDLTVQPLSQRYTRLTETSYRYQSEGGFSTEIVVDDLGLAIDYKGGWQRLGSV